MTQKKQNFEIWQGESKRLKASITEDGEPKDLAGATIVWAAYSSIRSVTATINKSTDVDGGITTIDIASTNDGVQVDIEPVDTQQLTPGEYYHECRVIDSSSNEEVVFIGEMKLHESKTIQEGE